MKIKLVFVVLTLLLLSFSVVRVNAVSVWISGKVSSTAEEKEYNGVYVEFMFEVANASMVGFPFPSGVFPFNMSCVVPISLANVSDFALDSQMNLTGEITGEPPVPNGVPAGYFLVSGINEETLVSPGWVETLKTIFITIANVGKMTVTLIVQVIGAFAGIEVPTYVVSLTLVGMIAFFFVKWGKKLPWILMLIAFLMCIALVSDLILGLHL